MNYYLDIISRNHELKEFTDTSTEEIPSKNSQKITKKMKGGEQKKKQDLYKSEATGCFPPIYKIKKEEKEKEKNVDKTRAFAQVKTALSIKDIMENRRNDDSFIAL